VFSFVTLGYAQEAGSTQGPAEAQAAQGVQETVGHPTEGGHKAFPPFDPATYGSQILWLVITFGALYLVMSRVALPRIGAILDERSNTIGADLGEAERLKAETDAAVAAYEAALAEARQRAQSIGQSSRDATQAEVERHRAALEADLDARVSAAETRIGEVKSRALGEVDAIAREATAALVEALIGSGAAPAEVDAAVRSAAAERSS
jgi:F-type H+-transporting ATPase subunit b